MASAQAPERAKPGSAPPADARTAPSGQGTVEPPISRTPSNVVAEPRTLDLGFMPPGTDAQGTITLRNTGDQPRIVRDVKVSCKCTTVTSIAGSIIPPGGSVEFQVKLEGARVQGPRRSNVNVVFDGDFAPLLVPIQGEVALPIRAVPPYINLVGDAPRSGRLVVEAPDKKPFKLLAVDGKAPNVSGGYDPATDSPRASYILEYDLSAVAAKERPEAYMLIETDREDCPVLDVRIRSERSVPRGRVKLADFRLNLGAMAPGESRVFDIGLLEPTELTSITAGSSDFTLELLGTDVDGKIATAHVKVTAGPSVAAGLFRFPVIAVAGSRQQELDAFGVIRAAAAPAEAASAPSPTP